MCLIYQRVPAFDLRAERLVMFRIYVFPILGIMKGITTAYLKQDTVLSYIFTQIIHQFEKSVP